MSKILILGSSGFLGTRVRSFFLNKGHEVFTASRSGPSSLLLDVTNKLDLIRKIPPLDFDIVLNLVAQTDVDACEDRPNDAFRSNVRSVENIVDWILERSPSSHLIQVSTDHVYDGLGPHQENEVSIVNTYALSKYAGELAAKRVPSTILRTNFFGRSNKAKSAGLSDWLFSSLTKGEKINVLSDVLFSPVSLATLCEVMDVLVRIRPVGVYNLGSSLGMSKANFSLEFASRLNLNLSQIREVKSSEASFHRTKRPNDMRMDSSKLESVLGITFPSLTDEIGVVVDEYRS